MEPSTDHKWDVVQTNEGRAHLQLVVPVELREKNIRDIHEGVVGGHLDQGKTLHCLKERFYWPGHYNNVKDWCQICTAFATRKSSKHSSKSPLGTITASYPTPQWIWLVLYLRVIEGIVTLWL